ncbi:hypothetical protein [Sphingobium herbicidovorans]|uniref:hypothetical protein n=1 Tax=Sphingobium herbicidovorans TaxID=76947 RepID=UPI0012E05979|nr:hypothetical protein [Sphingobium herbicidovorans]
MNGLIQSYQQNRSFAGKKKSVMQCDMSSPASRVLRYVIVNFGAATERSAIFSLVVAMEFYIIPLQYPLCLLCSDKRQTRICLFLSIAIDPSSLRLAPLTGRVVARLFCSREGMGRGQASSWPLKKIAFLR